MSNLTIISPEMFIPCELHGLIRTHEIMVNEIKLKSKNFFYSCDGLELASASNSNCGSVPIMGKEILDRVKLMNYHKQTYNPEFGDRGTGIYFISNVLLLIFLITLLLLIDQVVIQSIACHLKDWLLALMTTRYHGPWLEPFLKSLSYRQTFFDSRRQDGSTLFDTLLLYYMFVDET